MLSFEPTLEDHRANWREAVSLVSNIDRKRPAGYGKERIAGSRPRRALSPHSLLRHGRSNQRATRRETAQVFDLNQIPAAIGVCLRLSDAVPNPTGEGRVSGLGHILSAPRADAAEY
ncbi:hypothetical protein [Xanthobacter wiegelii]|uniref:hypothetical protein n=1 Tax=Xanthobacter wiegelii TaxID=3119913 RepID=UPI003728821E